MVLPRSSVMVSVTFRSLDGPSAAEPAAPQVSVNEKVGELPVCVNHFGVPYE